MKAIDFIQADLEREKKGRRFIFLIPLILSISMAGIGLGMRRDFVDAFSWSNLAPPLFILFVAGFFPWIMGNFRLKKLEFVLIAFALVASLFQPQTELSLKKFETPGSFWPEALHCFALGVVSSFFASAILSLLVYKLMPTPNRRVQLLCATVSGLCGIAALSFHCMGPLTSHNLVAHWGQALVVFPVAYAAQRIFISIHLRGFLKPNSKIENISKLSD